MSPAAIDPLAGFQALRNILVDRNTATLSGELSACGIPHLLLKGPAVARWLYDSDEVRAYFDTDLMVPQQRWADAVSLLERLGYLPEPDAVGHPRMEGITGYGFVNGEAHVDLHAALSGLGAAPEEAWNRLSRSTEPLDVGGTILQIFGTSARLMHVALHAAHHHDGVPLVDLERALVRVDDESWRTAAALADDLGATAFFVTGLRLVPQGAALVHRLGLDRLGSVEATLHVADIPLAGGLYDLLRTGSARTRLAIVRQEAFPSREFMRWWTPLARRPRGLPAAYAYRAGWLVAMTPRAVGTVVRAWRETRRRVGSG